MKFEALNSENLNLFKFIPVAVQLREPFPPMSHQSEILEHIQFSFE